MYTVLVCDDERDIVSALKIYLTGAGYRVLEAYNGEEALTLIGSESVQLVLLDIMMPRMDGITAMARIREKTNVPVILLTAKTEDTDKVLGLNVGADDYITKPFNPAEVLARVKSQIRRTGCGLRPRWRRCPKCSLLVVRRVVVMLVGRRPWVCWLRQLGR